MKEATIRVYEELNQFLPIEWRKRDVKAYWAGTSSIQDIMIALGIPLSEIDLVLCNGASVNFKYHVPDGARLSVYPVFESFDVSPITRMREMPLREVKFIVESGMDELLMKLRSLGFDSHYSDSVDDSCLINQAIDEKRIIITRRSQFIERHRPPRAVYIDETRVSDQMHFLVERLHLQRIIKPFSRCIACNVSITPENRGIPLLVCSGCRDKFNDSLVIESLYQWLQGFLDTLSLSIESLK